MHEGLIQQQWGQWQASMDWISIRVLLEPFILVAAPRILHKKHPLLMTRGKSNMLKFISFNDELLCFASSLCVSLYFWVCIYRIICSIVLTPQPQTATDRAVCMQHSPVTPFFLQLLLSSESPAPSPHTILPCPDICCDKNHGEFIAAHAFETYIRPYKRSCTYEV